MENDRTAEQLREEYDRVLGPTLAPLYSALKNEVIWVHAKWKQFGILFVDSPERIDLLNQVAGFFFRMIQDVLWEDTILHLTRLTDPPRSSGRDNLTLRRLPGAISDPSLSKVIAPLVEQACTNTSFAREWRNRHLAHQDLALSINEPALPLPAVNRQNMDKALSAVAAVLNRIEGHYWDTEIAFTEFIVRDDAESLAYYLKIAVAAESQQA